MSCVPSVDERPLWDLILGSVRYRTLLVAHEMGLFAMIDGARPTLTEICEALQIERRPAKAMLTACVAGGFLVNTEERYGLTPLARCYLLPESPHYFGAFLSMLAANDDVFSFRSTKKAIETNRAQVYGEDDLFLSHEQQASLARAFTHGMHGHSAGAAFAWPDVFDLGTHSTLLDVGGGSGVHAIAAATRWPSLRAIVLDIPPACAVASEYIERAGVAARVTTHAANMWSDPFPDADVHFYADICHDWPPAKCRALVQRSFDALPPRGRIVLHEMLLADDKSGPPAAAGYSMAMLLWTEGQQYSSCELRSILAETGFADVESKPTFGYWSVVSGVRPD